METEAEVAPLASTVHEESKLSAPFANHNPQLRRRNVAEKVNFAPEEPVESLAEDAVPLVNLPNSTRAFQDRATPRIPDTPEPESPSKQNGVLSREDDSGDRCPAVSEDTDDSEIAGNRERRKIKVIQQCVDNPELTFGELKLLGRGDEGFVNDAIRRVLWPKLLRLRDQDLSTVHDLDNIHTRIPNDVYQQIQKDVVRSGSHMPEDTNEEDMEHFHNQLTQIMCWVLHRHTELNYYQGYNDLAATVLLVMGLQPGIYVLEKISMEFLERFMEKTMEKVHQELFFIFALLERVHPTLLEHLENVELFPHFALAEYTTWYAHKYAENRKLLHRLFDYFLGSPPLVPLYLSTVIVANRATEIFNTTPDMGHTHKVLCTLPDDLPFEKLLKEATNLYHDYPPESITHDVTEYDHRRRKKEQEWKAKAEAGRKERERQRKLRLVQAKPIQSIPYRIRNYKTITVVTILALGIYAYLKTSAGLN